MKLQTIKRTLNYLIILCSLLFSFNNCSPDENFKGKNSSSSLSNASTSASLSEGVSCNGASACEDQLMRFYGGGYQQFLVQNCSTCHAAGPGKGQFANNNLCTSYSDFMQTGYTKVSNNAVSDAHNPPYSGPQHIQTINDLRLTWVKALAEYDICNGGTGSVANNMSLEDRAQFSLGTQVIPSLRDNEEKRLEFDLVQVISLKSLPVPNLPGARFSVMIKKEVKGAVKTYVVHSPRIFNSSQDVRIKGLFIKINGRFIQYSTNFRYLDTSIPKNTLETSNSSLLSTGALVIAGAMTTSDQVGFEVELLEPTVIPPPPPPVQLAINAPNAILANGSGFVDIEVTLNRPALEVVSFSISALGTPICGTGTETIPVSVNNSTCMPDVYNLICPNGSCAPNVLAFTQARSVTGTPFNRFNWDYKFDNISMVFAIGETSKMIRVNLSKDIRYESNKLLSVQIQAGLGNIVLGKSMTQIVFNKQKNPIPGPTETTYSMLMNPSNGILKINCNSCHNSDQALQQGGFDIADYELMVNRGVLQPGQDFRTINPVTGVVTKTYASKIFKRMNVQDPSNLGLTPMPRDGYLDYDTEISTVEKWILSGAKNN